MERLLSKLQSAINQQPLNVDYLEFLTRHELIMSESLSLQIDGVSEMTESLQNLHRAVQWDINVNNMPIVEQKIKVCPGSGRPKVVIEREN